MDVIGIIGLILAAIGLVDATTGSIADTFDPRFSKSRTELLDLAKKLQERAKQDGHVITKADAKSSYFRSILNSQPGFSDLARRLRIQAQDAEEMAKKARLDQEETNAQLNQVSNAYSSVKNQTSGFNWLLDQMSGRTNETSNLVEDVKGSASTLLQKGGINDA